MISTFKIIDVKDFGKIVSNQTTGLAIALPAPHRRSYWCSARIKWVHAMQIGKKYDRSGAVWDEASYGQVNPKNT